MSPIVAFALLTLTVNALDGSQTTSARSGQLCRAETGAAAPNAAKAKIDQLAWLGGNWLGTTDTAVFEERWMPPAGGTMLATARTLRSGVMRDFEFLCIVERGDGLVYQAMPSGRPAPPHTQGEQEIREARRQCQGLARRLRPS